jgi:hypothetical protein
MVLAPSAMVCKTLPLVSQPDCGPLTNNCGPLGQAAGGGTGLGTLGNLGYGPRPS